MERSGEPALRLEETHEAVQPAHERFASVVLIREGGCRIRARIDLCLHHGRNEVGSLGEVAIHRTEANACLLRNLSNRGIYARSREDLGRCLHDGGQLALRIGPHGSRSSLFRMLYPASKAALNAVTLAMMVELEGTGIKINLVSPGFTKTALNGFEGTESLEDGSREVVRVALLGPDGPTNTFTRWEDATIPW